VRTEKHRFGCRAGEIEHSTYTGIGSPGIQDAGCPAVSVECLYLVVPERYLTGLVPLNIEQREYPVLLPPVLMHYSSTTVNTAKETKNEDCNCSLNGASFSQRNIAGGIRKQE
jgi:hypothetical protein